MLVRSNEQFGIRLLNSLHAASPQRNLAVAPLPVTLMFAMFHMDSYKENEAVLGWNPELDLRYSSRMLLGAFDAARPEPPKPVKITSSPTPIMSAGEDALWITNAIVYRTPIDVKDVFAPHFVREAQTFYGTRLVDLRDRKPGSEDLQEAMRGLELSKLPAFSTGDDFAVTSALHLGCRWKGNLFVLNAESDGDFAVRSGTTKRVRMMNGETELFDHAKTDDFEAVSLPCHLASMTVVVPAAGTSLEDLALKIATDPSVVTVALRRELGSVNMPSFELDAQNELRPLLEAYGFKSVFQGMKRIILVDDSKLIEVNQSVHIRVDRSGIYADAGTLGGGILGGVLGGPKPFRMIVDRPFLFFVHDKAANVLLFAGVVTDPSQD
jgi:serpin B